MGVHCLAAEALIGKDDQNEPKGPGTGQEPEPDDGSEEGPRFLSRADLGEQIADHPVASELPFATRSGASMVPFASKPPSSGDWSADTEGVPLGLPQLLERPEPEPEPEPRAPLSPADPPSLVRHGTDEAPPEAGAPFDQPFDAPDPASPTALPVADQPDAEPAEPAEPDDENVFAFSDGATAEWTREQMEAMAEEEDDDDESDVPEAPVPDPPQEQPPSPVLQPTGGVEHLEAEVALLQMQVERAKNRMPGVAAVAFLLGAALGAAAVAFLA